MHGTDGWSGPNPEASCRSVRLVLHSCALAFKPLIKAPASRPERKRRAPSPQPAPFVVARGHSSAEAHADRFAARAHFASHARSSPPEAAAPLNTEAARPELARGIEEARASSTTGLESQARKQLERASGNSLAEVSVHDDARADGLARSLDAWAFSVGDDLFFRRGAYQPGNTRGFGLLAHEVAHTMQHPTHGGSEVVRLAKKKKAEELADVTRAWMSKMLTGTLGVPGDPSYMVDDVMLDAYHSATSQKAKMKTSDFKKVNPDIDYDAQTSTLIDRVKGTQRLYTTASGVRRSKSVSVTGDLLAHEQIHKDIAVFAVIQANLLINEIVEDRESALNSTEIQEVIDATSEFKERWSKKYYDGPGSIDGVNPLKRTDHDSSSMKQLEYWNTGDWYYDALDDWVSNVAPAIKETIAGPKMLQFGGAIP